MIDNNTLTGAEQRLQAVTIYLKGNLSLRKTAIKLNLHYRTLYRWVKRYRQGGKENLKRNDNYRKPHNRISYSLEKKIMLLKEQKPGLNLNKARYLLKKEGINLSIKGIWSVWYRHGLTNRSEEFPYAFFGPATSECRQALNNARKYLAENKTIEAANILNSLPACPRNRILVEIPENLLSLKRKLESLEFLRGKIPYPEYAKKSKELLHLCEKKKLYYSALIAGFHYINALQWMTEPQKKLSFLKQIKKHASQLHEPALRFLFIYHEATAWATLLNGKKVVRLLKECKRLAVQKPTLFFLSSVASVFTSLQDYKSAMYFVQKSFETIKKDEDKKIINLFLASCLTEMGKYKESTKLLKESEKKMESYKTIFHILQAQCAFGEGKLSRASYFLEKALNEAEAGALRNYLHVASFISASIYAALGMVKEARCQINKCIPLLKKFKIARDLLMRKILLKKIHISRNDTTYKYFKGLHLLFLLQKAEKTKKAGDYSKVLKFARKEGILGIFHRMIVFFPEIIQSLIADGKSTGLPKSIIMFSIFQRNTPVYRINFLGPLQIKRNNKTLRFPLYAKKRAFLIHLALKAEEPGKSIPLESIYRNFWSSIEKPSRNLSQLLWKLRSSIKLPWYLCTILKSRDYACLSNQGIYFITDYQYYKETITRAKALERVGEWNVARKEYLRAFKLFRGEPFKKMYDKWSEDMRRVILNRLENTTQEFVKSCVTHNNRKDAQKVLEKVRKIIPNSDEIQRILKDLC